MVNNDMWRRKVDLDFYLHRTFRKRSFRPLQREVCTAVVEGHDVFLQASTSFGKSLCFQLPAVATTRGMTIVVCPLLSLMTDQLRALAELEIPVATINSNTKIEERRAILQDMLSGHPTIRLLYVTPELCQTDMFRRNLQTVHEQGELVRIAIDEAHCVSEWGHDFRTAYKQLSWFRRSLTNPRVPISAFTATATPQVREDIINILGLDPSQTKIFSTPSARPNIHYEVRFLQDFVSDPQEPDEFQLWDLHSWLKAVQGRREARLGIDAASRLPPISGIVYVSTRRATVLLAQMLSRNDPRIRAVAYHAGLDADERIRTQNEWIAATRQQQQPNTTPITFYIIVATTAFGMGIDNPNVRFVVHWSPSKTFEGFVQESGRAGRDGRAATSIIYYNPQERERSLGLLHRDIENLHNRTGGRSRGLNNRDKISTLQSLYARKQSFGKLVQFCESTTRCRHEMIGEFFGDVELVKMGSQVPAKPDVLVQPEPDVKTGISSNAGAGESPSALITSPCDFACDFCKDPKRLAERKERMIRAEELAFLEVGPDWFETMIPRERMFPELVRRDG
ncbi:P-loop containing nucleoside triphosphate hydrolase protein [Aspergillus venezuelensis]